MSNNEFISLPTQDIIKTILAKRGTERVVHETTIPATSGNGFTMLTAVTEEPVNNDVALTATDFARHTGLAVAHNADQELNEIWLGNRGELRDTVQIYQADANGRRTFSQRNVSTPTVGVMPCLLNNDAQPFGTTTTKDGQTNLLIGKGLARYPQSGVDANTAAALDYALQAYPTADNRHPTRQIGFTLVGSFTAPDTGRQCPCYRWHEQTYALHTNRDGHTAWFRCDPIAVRSVNNGHDLLIDNVLFAAPFSNLHNFRTRTQGVNINDELNLSQFALGRYLQDVFLPELVKSTTLDLTTPVDKVAFVSPKLSKLNVALPRENDQERTK